MNSAAAILKFRDVIRRQHKALAGSDQGIEIVDAMLSQITHGSYGPLQVTHGKPALSCLFRPAGNILGGPGRPV